LAEIEGGKVVYACTIHKYLFEEVMTEKKAVYFMDLNTINEYKKIITMLDENVVLGKEPSSILFHADRISSSYIIPQQPESSELKEWTGEEVPECIVRGSSENSLGLIYVEKIVQSVNEKISANVQRVVL